MTSVVIAAHNEAAVLGRCLDALLTGHAPGELDITVVANGCTDDTAMVAAARPGVRVLDLPEAGKARALNAGDAVAVGFPRVYLDADIVLPAGALRLLCAALAGPPPGGLIPPLAVVPRRRLALAGRPLLVRAFYTINSRLPAYRNALFGRGAIALAADGRARFDVFPDEIADDLYLDSLFTAEEKLEVAAVTSVIATPRRTRDLLRRLVRVRAGNARLRGSHAATRPAARWSWLRDVVLRSPWLAPAAVCYVVLTVAAAMKARGVDQRWGRDESTRSTELAR